MARFSRRLRRALHDVAAVVRRPRRVTCLECGFLAHEGKEVTMADRAMFAARGSSGMMANPERVQCFRSLWVSYDLTYASDDIFGVFDEIEVSRRDCLGYHPYQPGWSPQAHLELATKAAERRWNIWVMVGSAAVGGMITLLVTWLTK